MKARIFNTVLLLAATMMATTSFAQNEPIEIGVKFGGQSSNAIGHGVNLGLDILSPRSILTPGISTYADIPLGKGFYFSPEAGFRQKGFKVAESVNINIFEFPIPVGAEAVTRMNYIDAATNLKYKFGNGRVSGFVRGGPYVGYAMSGKTNFRVNSLIDFNVGSVNINPGGNLYERWEYGAVAGAGVEFTTGSGKFFLEGTYQRAFNDFTNVPVIDAGLQNQSFGLNVGFAIPIGRKATSSIGS